MILVDTSVWIDHLARTDKVLASLLMHGSVLVHTFVLGEIAMGSLPNRSAVLNRLNELPSAIQAQDAEVMRFVEIRGLYNRGIGYIDAHLLASVELTPGAILWTRDRRLNEAARALSLPLLSDFGS